jgi:hypothetical protein
MRGQQGWDRVAAWEEPEDREFQCPWIYEVVRRSARKKMRARAQIRFRQIRKASKKCYPLAVRVSRRGLRSGEK